MGEIPADKRRLGMGLFRGRQKHALTMAKTGCLEIDIWDSWTGWVFINEDQCLTKAQISGGISGSSVSGRSETPRALPIGSHLQLPMFLSVTHTKQNISPSHLASAWLVQCLLWSKDIWSEIHTALISSKSSVYSTSHPFPVRRQQTLHQIHDNPPPLPLPTSLNSMRRDRLNVVNKLNFCFQETQRLQQEPVAGIVAVPNESNARYFHITIAGPEGVSLGSLSELWEKQVSCWFLRQEMVTLLCPLNKCRLLCSLHTKVAPSNWNYFYQRNIPCQRRKFASWRKSTIRT